MVGLYIFGTLSAIAAFAGVCWWAYRPGNKQRFEQDGRLAIDTDPVHQHRHFAGDKLQ